VPTPARSGPGTSHSGRTQKADLSLPAAAFALLVGAEAEAEAEVGVELALGPGWAYQL